MNFQAIPPVQNTKDLLEVAFKKARMKSKATNLKGNWLQIIRQKECLKIDVVKDTISNKLKKIMNDFPDTTALPFFYIRLMKITLDYPEFKRSLGAINWAVGKILGFQKSYVSKITKTKDRVVIKGLTKEFYGRVASVLKQIGKQLKSLEESRKKMKNYPDIKDMFTVCIYGFPNVGKTTLLNKITGTNAETAAYAFTTKSINVGYFKSKDNHIQLIDVPGTLARPDKMNNIERLAELVVEELASIIIFVFDLSGFSGYSIEVQQQLLERLGLLDNEKKLLIFLSKKDIIDKDVIDSFDLKHYSLNELKEIVSKSA
jgi:nucleolar GTP-binding protein